MPIEIGHLVELFQEVDLAVDFFTEPDIFFGHVLPAQLGQIGFLGSHQRVDAVQSHPAVVPDQAAASVGVGQAGDDAAVAGGLHFRRIDAENAVIVGGSVAEMLPDGVRQLEAVILAGLLGHPDAAERIDAALQGPPGLQADDDFVLTVEIAGRVIQQGRHRCRIDIEDAAHGDLDFLELFEPGIQAAGPGGRRCQERLIPGIRPVIILDEVADINSLLPCAGLEALPRR